LVAWRLPRTRTFVPIPWAAFVCASGFLLAANAPDDRRVVAGAAALAIAEVGIVTAIATVFSSFSSPFLTATFTFGVFIVGRSADTLAHLPERLFGTLIHRGALGLSKVVPNLMLYAPPRSLLTGEAVGVSLSEYLLLAAAQALAWSVFLLAAASFIFRRRDFL
jgi:Cu-processing system permease protein